MKGIAAFLVVVCFIAASSHGSDPMESDNKFEGDMVISPDQYLAIVKGVVNPKIPLAATKTNHWPKKIFYEISAELRKEDKFMKRFKEAISDYHRYTCLRFHPKTNQKGFMFFFKEDGCWAFVGHGNGNKPRKLSLGSGCWSKGIIMHEIAHSLGFHHEQSRPDRDGYVKIRFENIKPGKEGNFKKYTSAKIDSMGSPYDFESLMHYRGTSFSKNGQKTIETNDPANQKRIGQRGGLSKYDIKQINKLYKCGTVIPPPTPKPTAPPSVTRRRRTYRRRASSSRRRVTGIFTHKPTKPTIAPKTAPATRPPTRKPATRPSVSRRRSASRRRTSSSRRRTAATKKPITPKPAIIYKTVHVCQNKLLNVRCPSGKKIMISYATFGFIKSSSSLTKLQNCNKGTTLAKGYCRSSTASKAVKHNCQGRAYCRLIASTATLGTPKQHTGSCSKAKFMLTMKYKCA